MMNHTRWMILAMGVVLLSTADADAFGRRRRCNGGGGHGCHGGSYGGCHGGGRVYNGGCHGGGHGGCHGGRVIYNGHGGCHGSGCHGGTVYGGRPMYHGSEEQGGERLPQPRRDRDDFNENGSETGQIYFRAPQGAQVWVDGQLIERRGDNWVWTSPALTGRRSFEVRARWNEDGRVVNRTRTVNVQSGGRTTLDFNRAEGSEIIPATGESDRDLPRQDDRDSSATPRSKSTPNTTPQPRDTDSQPRPGARDLEPRNPATPRSNIPPAAPDTPATPKTQPRQ